MFHASPWLMVLPAGASNGEAFGGGSHSSEVLEESFYVLFAFPS